VHQRMTSARRAVPSGQRTPSSRISSNIGSRFSTPRACMASIAGVTGSPVTETTELCGKPRRTLSSTSATAARPRSSVKEPSRKSGGLRVTQVVVVTRETSSSSCIAEIPPPTTMTCLPANSSAVR
jgi:hypothetical protein